MSVLGTGIAAAVAQTASTAQQVARNSDSRRNEAARKAKKNREVFETHLQALDEGDDSDSPAQLHIDGQLPGHQTPEAPQKIDNAPHAHSEQQAIDTIEPDASQTADTPCEANSPLYRHLDIRA